MDLSFIICTYNGAGRLPETLAHLAAQANRGGHSWEVLVVDNASTDGTAEVAGGWAARFAEAGAGLRVLSEPTPGKTHAIKAGLRAAAGRYFTLVDDDNHLCPGWLDTAVAFMDAHPRAGLIGGKILPTFEAGAVVPADFEHRYKGYLAIRDYGQEEKLGVMPIGAGMTGRTSLMRALYERLGSYLPDRVGAGLGSCEDLEKGTVVRHLGWEVWYVPGLEMRHWIPKGRLTETYIDRLWVEAAVAGAWLRVLELLGPTEPGAIGALAEGDRRLLRREGWLCRLPGWLHPRLKRARFWRGYYAARVAAYEELARRSGEVAAMFERIRSMPAELRPPAEPRPTAASRRPAGAGLAAGEGG
ncbi:MAG: glycosyltransferase [Tepidisphaerales bacterium]